MTDEDEELKKNISKVSLEYLINCLIHTTESLSDKSNDEKNEINMQCISGLINALEPEYGEIVINYLQEFSKECMEVERKTNIDNIVNDLGWKFED